MSEVNPSTVLELSDAEQQDTSRFGMWIFLAGEVLFFGAVFTAYLVYRISYPQIFAEASQHLSVLLGTINTAVLLTSSFTMALAVSSTHQPAQVGGQRRKILLFLGFTILLGLAFLGIKAVEYSRELAENLFPGNAFQYTGANPERARLFFSLYFILTGLHAVHMLIGLSILAILSLAVWRTKFPGRLAASVELTGLFWHFIDLVWIFIFPLLYLIHPK
jgi:cytochrome c oxidase subunit III